MSVIGANYFISSNSLDSSWKKVFYMIFEHRNLEYKVCIFFYASHCMILIFCQVVDFLPPFYTGHINAYMRATEVDTLLQFLRPFSWQLWLTVLVMLLVFSFIFFLINNIQMHELRGRISLQSRWGLPMYDFPNFEAIGKGTIGYSTV